MAGLVLAAGAGRRYGRPKALVRDAGGVPWPLARARTLRDGGCDRVLVVLGAAADEARALWPADPSPDVEVVVADAWQEGMGASLRAGLAAVGTWDPPPVAALVALVDTPGLTAPAVARLVAVAAVDVLAQAAYAGVPGHPVLLGRDHWAGAAASAAGDRGARDYLRTRPVRRVECGDVADGTDVDTPGDHAGPAHHRT